MGVSEEDIDKYIDHISDSERQEENHVLTIKFCNNHAFHWLIEHPLIWLYGNDGDGLRLLLGMDYARINQIFEIEDHINLRDSVFRRDLFFRLMQIEIGAKASFDKRLQKHREDEQLKRKHQR